MQKMQRNRKSVAYANNPSMSPVTPRPSPSEDPSSFGSTTSLHQDLYMQELQVSKMNKDETPTLVKRLTLVMLVYLFIVIALLSMHIPCHMDNPHVGVESKKLVDETHDLQERFQMIEYYQMRYELLIYLMMNPLSYTLYRVSTISEYFEPLCNMTETRIERVTQYNILTRRSFSRLGMNYDYEAVTVYSDGDDLYVASFYYAFIIVYYISAMHGVVHQRDAPLFKDQQL